VLFSDTDYIVRYRPSDSFDDEEVTVNGTTAVELSDLTPGTEYVVTVQSKFGRKLSNETEGRQSTLPLVGQFQDTLSCCVEKYLLAVLGRPLTFESEKNEYFVDYY